MSWSKLKSQTLQSLAQAINPLHHCTPCHRKEIEKNVTGHDNVIETLVLRTKPASFLLLISVIGFTFCGFCFKVAEGGGRAQQAKLHKSLPAYEYYIYTVRRKWITDEKPTLSDIKDEYPCLFNQKQVCIFTVKLQTTNLIG